MLNIDKIKRKSVLILNRCVLSMLCMLKMQSFKSSLLCFDFMVLKMKKQPTIKQTNNYYRFVTNSIRIGLQWQRKDRLLSEHLHIERVNEWMHTSVVAVNTNRQISQTHTHSETLHAGSLHWLTPESYAAETECFCYMYLNWRTCDSCPSVTCVWTERGCLVTECQWFPSRNCDVRYDVIVCTNIGGWTYLG